MVERSTTERIANYEEIAEKTLPNNSQEQILSNEEMTAQHLKFTILLFGLIPSQRNLNIPESVDIDPT